jgi:nicotinamidase-related amidase
MSTEVDVKLSEAANNSTRIRRAAAGIAALDMQERLLPAISNSDAVLTGAARLLRGAAILKLPIVTTEQYTRGLGRTVEAVASLIPGFAPLEKTVFSAFRASGFAAALEKAHVLDVILCGVEAHVCVYQTCLDLVAAGYRVFVVADVVGSRTPENCRIGLDRMRDAGAAIVSVEMALFDLVGEAGTMEFKQILGLLK